MITYTKHPDEITEVQYDFTAWLATIGDAMLDFIAVGDSGIGVASIVQAAGIVTVLYSGGDNGSAYNVGVKITTSGGDVKIDMRRMRVAGVAAPAQTVGGSQDILIDGGNAASFQ